MPGCWKLSWCLCGGDRSRPKISSPHVPHVSPPVHLLLKPTDAELLGHTFKQKKFRKSRPCNLCHQPVKNIGSSCRVCKYSCHRTCEPKVWRACRHRHGNSSFKAGGESSEPLMSRSSPFSKQMATTSGSRGRFLESPSRRAHSVDGCSSMDLSFVTERILALSFPPEMEPGVYRDALHQAANMLQTKHGDNYMVFNLSLPKKEIGLWNPRVLDVGWSNQLAPPLERLCSVCRALDSWLQADPQHVAVLHSRSGLQRVGVVVAAYCEYTGLSCTPNQDQSLDRFSMKRFLNERVGGLGSPSDKRYVEYFAGLLSGSIQVNSSPLFLDHLTVVGIPAFQSNGGCRAFFKVYQGSVPVHTSSICNLHDSARHFTVPMGERGLALRGDILVKCYHRHRQPIDGRETVFSLQFHTCAVTQHTLVFQRQDLDDACQDLRFPLDGSVRLHFSTGSESRLGVNETHTRYTVESSAGDAIVRWDSYDTVADSCSEHHDVSSSGSLSAIHRLAHIYGPLDGSLYAKVLKSQSIFKTPPLSSSNSPPPLIDLGQQLKETTIGGEARSASRFSDPNSTASQHSSQSDHHYHHHHHHRLAPSVGGVSGQGFLNSLHVASTDSGISSAGVVRSAGGSSGGGGGGGGGGHHHHRGDLGGSASAGSTSASPPHSGHSTESSAVVFDSPSTPSPVQQQQQQQLRKMPSIVETRAEVHNDHHNHHPVAMMKQPNGSGEQQLDGSTISSSASPTLTATAELDQLLSGMLMNVQNIPDIRPSQRHFQRGNDIDVDSIQVKFDLGSPAAPAVSSRDTTDSTTTRKKSINNFSSSPAYVYESDTVRRAATHSPPESSVTVSTTASEMINLFNSVSMGAVNANANATAGGPPKSASTGRAAKDIIPYHAREDSKPFTYGMVSNGAHRQDSSSGSVGANGVVAAMATTTSTPTVTATTSPPIQRRNWKESSNGGNNNNTAAVVNNASASGGGSGQAKALESPSLVRKFSTGSEPTLTPVAGSISRSAPRIPPPSIAEPTSPRPMRKLSETMLINGSGNSSNILPVATSSPRLDSTRTRTRSASANANANHPLSSTPNQQQQQLQHHISLEESIQDISTSPDSSRMSSEMTGLSWLQRQQQKLRERKDSLHRAERHPQEARLLSELRSSHQFKGQQQLQQLSRPGDDGYLSDVTMFSELDMVNTSREGSPDIRSLYATPLHINTANAHGQQYQQSKLGHVSGGYNRTLSSSSNPRSPLFSHRSSSVERNVRYPGSSESQQQQQQQQQEQSRMMILTRQKSDISYDRERPFVAVKRAHEQLKGLSNGRQVKGIVTY